MAALKLISSLLIAIAIVPEAGEARPAGYRQCDFLSTTDLNSSSQENLKLLGKTSKKEETYIKSCKRTPEGQYTEFYETSKIIKQENICFFGLAELFFNSEQNRWQYDPVSPPKRRRVYQTTYVAKTEKANCPSYSSSTYMPTLNLSPGTVNQFFSRWKSLASNSKRAEVALDKAALIDNHGFVKNRSPFIKTFVECLKESKDIEFQGLSFPASPQPTAFDFYTEFYLCKKNWSMHFDFNNDSIQIFSLEASERVH